jgi:hypothetical protein
LEPSKGIKTVIEAFKQEMKERIENEPDEKRKEVMGKALHRGTELLKGE